MSISQLLSGRGLIYTHKVSESWLSDEILMYIFPKNEINRRTDRLRIILPVTIQQQPDPSTKVRCLFRLLGKVVIKFCDFLVFDGFLKKFLSFF